MTPQELPELLYADRDVLAMREHYCRHVDAMTREGLHDKCDIAAELAWRDSEIARLEAALAGAGAVDGDDAGAREERCESGTQDCGPVTHWDCDGVPLCDTCWKGLAVDVGCAGEGG